LSEAIGFEDWERLADVRTHTQKNMIPILEKVKETHDVGPFCSYPLMIYAHLIRNETEAMRKVSQR